MYGVFVVTLFFASLLPIAKDNRRTPKKARCKVMSFL